jgi:5-methylcytosine-specific restriction enzyme subunit McrC
VDSLELFEWERGNKQSPFKDSELSALKKFNDLIVRKEKANALTVTFGKIHTYSFVGIIQIGKKRIEILPKLYNPDKDTSLNSLSDIEKEKVYRTARKNLFSLLSISGLIPFYKSKLSKYGKEKDFYEFLISLFLTDLERIMGTSFHHEYMDQTDEMRHIKGKLNYKEQVLKLPSDLHTFSCNFDEFSIDNPLNRLIKAALLKIQRVSRNEDNKKRAFHFYTLMHEIQDEIISPSYMSKLHFTRLNENLKGVVEFSFMILFGSTYSAEEGPQQFYALIFDMNLVFEKYVTKLLRNTFQEYTFYYQHDLHLASEYHSSNEYSRNKKRVTPDIIVTEKGNPLAIIDTKYKPDFSNGFIKNADIYQIMAYSVANESDNALLLFPNIRREDKLKEKESFVVLDKLVTKKKLDRSILISAYAIQLFDERGKIRKTLADEDTCTIKNVISKKIEQ